MFLELEQTKDNTIKEHFYMFLVWYDSCRKTSTCKNPVTSGCLQQETGEATVFTMLGILLVISFNIELTWYLVYVSQVRENNS